VRTTDARRRRLRFSSSFVIVVVGNKTAYERLEKALQDKNNPLSSFGLSKLRFESAILMQ
jgi:hypothetical protein